MSERTDRNEALRLADELVEEAERRVCHVAMAPASLLKDAAALLRQQAEQIDQLRAEVERLRVDAERISVPSELIKRLDASIAWLERGEGLPGHSACIGLEDIKTIRQILSSGITYASNSGLPEKGESVTKVIGMPAEPSLHLLDVGWGICGGDGHASAQPNRQKINAAAANYKALRAALDAARTTHKETE